MNVSKDVYIISEDVRTECLSLITQLEIKKETFIDVPVFKPSEVKPSGLMERIEQMSAPKVSKNNILLWGALGAIAGAAYVGIKGYNTYNEVERNREEQDKPKGSSVLTETLKIVGNGESMIKGLTNVVTSAVVGSAVGVITSATCEVLDPTANKKAKEALQLQALANKDTYISKAKELLYDLDASVDDISLAIFNLQLLIKE